MTALTASRERTGSDRVGGTIAAGLALLAAGAFEYTVLSMGEDARSYVNRDGVALFSAARAGFLALAILFFVPRLKKQVAFALWPVIAVYGWFALTLLWTGMPGETLSGLFRFACALAPGLWVATAPDIETAMARLGQAALLVLGVTLVAVIAFPDLAVMHGQHEGALRGAFMHKNVLGFHLALAGLICLARLLDTGKPGWVLAYGLAIGGIILAQATGALFASVVGAALILSLVLGAALMGRRVVAFAFILCLLAVPVFWLLPALLGPLAAPLGYDAGLNGRDLIWSFAGHRADTGGVLGHGYEAFWPKVLPAGYEGFVHNWLPAHAHNGFLDAWLMGGAAGAALVGVLFMILWWRGLRALALCAPMGTRMFPFAATLVLINWE